MKKLSDYTYAELLEELRNRGCAIAVWAPEDIDTAVEDFFEDDQRLIDNPLTEDEKAEILRQVDDNHDCNYGITWEHIQIAIKDYIDTREP